MRKATSESCRISLSVSCDIRGAWRAYRSRCATAVVSAARRARASSARSRVSGGDDRALLEMLVRGAVVAPGERRALARLALARRRPAAGNAAVEQARLDLLLDEVDCGLHALLHRPCDLRLRGDGEMAPDVLEQRPVGLRKVEGIARQPLHRLLACLEDGAARFQLGLAVGVRINQVFDGLVDGP